MDLMTLEDLPFVVGPVVGPLVAASVWAVVLVSNRATGVVIVSTVLAMTVFVSFLAYWAVWGVGFDAADAGRPVPVAVERISSLAIGLSATSVGLLLALGAFLMTGRGARSDRAGVPA